MTSTTATRRPLILIVDDHEWSSRSLESVLSGHRYGVIVTNRASHALEIARTQLPDLLFINNMLPNTDGVDLCRKLREAPYFGAIRPILVTSLDPPTRTQRLAALRAGAWEFITHPIDAEELLMRLDSYLRGTSELDRLREESLIDELTGLYDIRGLERRVQEMASQATRDDRALACIVIATTLEFDREREPLAGNDAAISATAARCGSALQSVGRSSDALGRLGRLEFAVVASGTDNDGAIQLAQRLGQALRSALEQEDLTSFDVRAGFDAVSNIRESSMAPGDLLVHATSALRESKRLGDSNWIRPFQRT